MFARKKTADVQTSLQRFCDLHRDVTSRAKHFRLAIELLSSQEKCQLVDDFNFETFHLIDSLLLHPDLCLDAQLVYDAESALWTLEQVLCYAPELVGKGWQQNAIESILKRALLPQNVMAVRKIAIRLFLIWYQTLAIYGKATSTLDTVFQCCLPFFPLRVRQKSEQILQAYCENLPVNQAFSNGNSATFEPAPLKVTPIIMDSGAVTSPTFTPTISSNVGVRERAQTLQIYLDKFLEYCCRETMKIEWSDESKRLNCAKFILDRVILLYISEIFSDIESNGVDIFGGWEGDEQTAQFLDTADPVVIARYWLVRWIVNIAMAPMTENPSAGLLLYRQAVFSSQKATNSLLTMMREAMHLPLACSNVIHKVIALARCWILQRDIPPFIDSGLVSLETWNALLIHSLFLFFRSAYLRSSGDRLPAAISLTCAILAVAREFANPAVSGVLPRSPPANVWAELMRNLNESVLLICERVDAYGSATAGAFARTLLSVAIHVRVIREVELDDKMWSDIWLVFRSAVWTQFFEQWSKFAESMTCALILNLFAIDINQLEGGTLFCSETNSTGSLSTRRHGASTRMTIVERLTSIGAGGSESASITEGESELLSTGIEEDGQHGNSVCGSSENGERNNEKDFQNVIQSTGNVYLWLRSWMRVMYLVDPAEQVSSEQKLTTTNIDRHNNYVKANFSHQREAVQTLARAMEMLLRCGCADVLVQWLAARLLHNRLLVSQQPHALVPLCAVLTRVSSGSPLPQILHTHILLSLRACFDNINNSDSTNKEDQSEVESVAQLAFEQMPQMSVEDLDILSEEAILTLQRLLKSNEFSARAVRVAAILCLNHAEVEKILISLLENPSIETDLVSIVLSVNALSIVISERLDVQLLKRLSMSIANNKNSHEILPIFCTNLLFLARFGLSKPLTDVIQRAILSTKRSGEASFTERFINDLKWHFCALSARNLIDLYDWHELSECFVSDSFLEGILWQFASQYPLSGFSISQWNSQQQQSLLNVPATTATLVSNFTFLETDAAILNFDNMDEQKFLWSRTVVGRHCYSAEILDDEFEPQSEVNLWLGSLSKQDENVLSAEQKNSDMLSNQIDPFKELARPTLCSNNTLSSYSNAYDTSMDIAYILRLVCASTLMPENFHSDTQTGYYKSNEDFSYDNTNTHSNWRHFLSDFSFVERTHNVPANFHRELRHLDSTMSRDVHKVAVVYVASDQEEKHSILSNIVASETFNEFVKGLGWLVQVGAKDFHGYAGGLPQGQLAPYYATTNTELIFHVSTLLTGDTHQKMKHLGNDEVHVVWSEHSRPYRRDILATRFCDVLIVLYPIGAALIRVHIETQNAGLVFGPLFDGALVHFKETPLLVRETVLNASRAYRNARMDCDRPNKHREKVFGETKAHLKRLSLAESIVRLYSPTPN